MDTAGRILQAARASFARKGLAGISMREIARAVGVTPMAIYRHYRSKQALIDALVLDALAEWSARVAAIPPAEPLEWLRRIGEAHLEFALNKPRRYEAAFLVHSSKARRYPEDFAAGRSPAGTLQLQLITQLMERGALRAESAMEVLLTVAALAQGLITLHRAGRIARGRAAFIELYRHAMERCMASFAREART